MKLELNFKNLEEIAMNFRLLLLNDKDRGRGSGGRSQSFSSRGRGFTQSTHREDGRGGHWQKNELQYSLGNGRGQERGYAKSSIVYQICERSGHSAMTCCNRFNNLFQTNDISKALSALQLSDP